nr:unnamed protein product [Callosobruchus chinensis]
MIWHEHGYVFRARKYFLPNSLLTLYKAQISPSLEYCSHIRGVAAPTTLSILDAVQRRKFNSSVTRPYLATSSRFLTRVLLVTAHSSTGIQSDSAPPS